MDDTQAVWTPTLPSSDQPLYLAVADAIGEAVSKGELAAGAKMPTHRALAKQLELTVSTINRAYVEAERRGFLKAHVGRGTYVREEGEAATADSGVLDMTLSVSAVPVNEEERTMLEGLFMGLSASPELMDLLEPKPHLGRDRDRRAGARLIGYSGLEVDYKQVVVTCGCQHSMNILLSTIAKPGDLLITENLTYAGLRGLAKRLDLNVRGVPMDHHGLRPDLFEAICQREQVRALYTIPTMQNPTNTIMPLERREEIARIARQYNVLIIEDDVYGFLAPDAPKPITALAPELGCYMTSISKAVAPGFRIGYMSAPEELIPRLGGAMWSSTWMAPPPMAALVTDMIERDLPQQFAAIKRQDAEVRNRIAAKYFDMYRHQSHPNGFHIWLYLPDPWHIEDFVLRAHQAGIDVVSAKKFAISREFMPEAVRISLTCIPTLDRLEDALTRLAQILKDSPSGGLNVV